LEPSPVVT